MGLTWKEKSEQVGTVSFASVLTQHCAKLVASVQELAGDQSGQEQVERDGEREPREGEGCLRGGEERRIGSDELVGRNARECLAPRDQSNVNWSRHRTMHVPPTPGTSNPGE